jgi:spore maturation protein CgeB
VEINRTNFEEKILYYLEHEDERKRIVENAFKTILKYHTVETRARELLRTIKENLK